MAAPRTTPASLLLCLAQSAIAAVAAYLFLQPLATGPGLVSVLVAAPVAYTAAYFADRAQLRFLAGLVFAAVLVGLGHFLSRFVLAHELAGTTTAIELADVLYLGLVTVGLLLALRLLRQRFRAFAILEVAAIVGAIAHTFADHRRQRIHQPRALSDWAFAHGLDPQTLLTGIGIACVAFGALVLLRGQRLAKLLLTLLLLLLSGVIAYLLLRDGHIATPADTNDLGVTAEQKQSKSGGGADGKPDPVAIALLHDELDTSGVLYFRQTARSRLAGERLVEDTSHDFDRDLLAGYPVNGPIRGASTQAPEFHRSMSTSMFLMVAHPQPVGLGHPVAYIPLDNPDPKRFVAAYGVESALLTAEPLRLLGRPSIPKSWSEAERAHYLGIPDDPRYQALSDAIVRELDPRYFGDPVLTAYGIKRYLEKEGFYSLAQKEMTGTDPTARFLFGDMRGYCVHFAHAAVFLFRSQGIPARVALGYAVDSKRRGAGSAVLISGSDAHAWPEIFVDGVGWVTFDIYPERSDEPPHAPVEADLEQLLGEIARKDPTGGRTGDPRAGSVVPWRALGLGACSLLGALLAIAYAIKLIRRFGSASMPHVYRGFLDKLSELDLARRSGESRERHAERLAPLAPSFVRLTDAHLRWALGPRTAEQDLTKQITLARQARDELRAKVSLPRRIAGFLHPIGWLFTR